MSGSPLDERRASGQWAVMDLPVQAPLILGLTISLPLLVAACVLFLSGRFGPHVHAQSTVPDRPVIAGFEDDTGIQGDRITSDDLPTLLGTAGPSLAVRVYRGATVVGDVNSGMDGTWSLGVGRSLSDGPYSFTATAADKEGNVSGRSKPFVLTIDTTPPDKPVIVRFDDDTGLPKDNTTKDTTLTLTGRRKPGAASRSSATAQASAPPQQKGRAHGAS